MVAVAEMQFAGRSRVHHPTDAAAIRSPFPEQSDPFCIDVDDLDPMSDGR
jgi:hypothetical protein